MILEEASKEAFCYYPSELKPQSHKVVLAACDICGEFKVTTKNAYYALCKSCSLKGHTVTEETKRKIREAIKGKTVTDETKRKQSEAHKGDKSSSWKGGKAERKCKGCGNIFYVPQCIVKNGDGNYCSKSCSVKSKTGEKSSNWKGGEVKRKCKVCGKTFYVKPNVVKKGNGIYCSHSCRMKAQRHNARPTKTVPERKFEAICNKYLLPFKFVGDGSLWLGNAIPDFVHTSKKIALEVFGDYWHSPLINRNIRYTGTVEGRTEQLAAEGYKTIILWDIDLMREDAEKFILHEMCSRGIIK